MAYKQKGCTPVTAKIKRTTQGGMVKQPLLNMGAPVKMKSPAKQTKANDFKSKYDAQEKAKADKAAKDLKAKKEADISSYNKRLDRYRNDVLSLDLKKASKSYGTKDYAMNAAARKSKNITNFENNLFNYDSKKNPKLTEGYTPKEYAMSKATGTYKSKATKVDTPVSDTNTDLPISDTETDLTKNNKNNTTKNTTTKKTKLKPRKKKITTKRVFLGNA